MQNLIDRLIRMRFAPAGTTAVQRALCISRREAGRNPGAVSPSHDHGLAQVNEQWSRVYDFTRIHDPVYAVGVFWAMSSGGRQFSPWNGGAYPC